MTEITKEWCIQKAMSEDNAEIGVGLMAVNLPSDVADIIISDPRMWADTIRTIARQRAGLERRLAGRVKPIEPDDVDCGVPHLVEG